MKLRLLMVQADSLTPLDEKFYRENALRDDFNQRGYFFAQTYFRDDSKRLYIPAFEIQAEAGDDLNGNYDLAHSTNKNGADFRKFHHDKRTGFYFDRGVGYSTAGLTYIHILKDGKIFGAAHKLITVPGEMTLAEYEAMIREILFIRRELFQANSKAALTEGVKSLSEIGDWTKILEHLSRRVEEIFRLMKKINRRPRYGIKKIQSACRIEKIRRFDESFLRQFVKAPSRAKFRVMADEVSTNIFENRLLLNKLTRLKDFLLKSRAQQILNAESDARNVFAQMAAFMKDGGLSNWKNFLAAKTREWRQLESRKRALERTFDAILRQKNSQASPSAPQVIELTFRKIERFEISAAGRLKLSFAPAEGARWKFGELSGEWSRLLVTADVRQQLALFENIHGKNLTLKIRGQFKSGRNGGKVEIVVNFIGGLAVNGQKINLDADFERAGARLKNIYVQRELSRNYSYETKSLTYHAIQNLEQRRQRAERDGGAANLFQGAIEKLDACLALPFLRDAENRNEPWRMTQIFTNDAAYHGAYVKLRALDKVFDFSFDAEENFLPAEKLYQIYEWWVLAKLLEFLIVKLNWRAADGANPAEIFRGLFDAREIFEKPPIHLIHEKTKLCPRLDLEIFYDTEINKALKTSRCILRPDFLFKVTANGETRIFILDAKYRNYERQPANQWAAKDLFEVCAEKYIRRIKDYTGKDVSMAFIVHPDNTPADKKNFLGKYVTFNATGDPRCRNFFRELDGGSQQVGAFYLLPNVPNAAAPNQSEQNLELFFQIMFEYFMNQWESCWQCGGGDVEIETLLTNGGYEKYYLRCRKCGAFWIKSHCHRCGQPLIKHFTNYHVAQENHEWFVTCPNCGHF